MEDTHNDFMDKEDILACNDVELLAETAKYSKDIADDVKAQLEVAEELGSKNDDWKRRACSTLALHRMVQKRCQNRLKELGFYRDQEIETLKRHIARLDAKLMAQKNEVEA